MKDVRSGTNRIYEQLYDDVDKGKAEITCNSVLGHKQCHLSQIKYGGIRIRVMTVLDNFPDNACKPYHQHHQACIDSTDQRDILMVADRVKECRR